MNIYCIILNAMFKCSTTSKTSCSSSFPLTGVKLTVPCCAFGSQLHQISVYLSTFVKRLNKYRKSTGKHWNQKSKKKRLQNFYNTQNSRYMIYIF